MNNTIKNRSTIEMSENVVSYALSGKAWDGYENYIDQIIQNKKCRTVCEIGGGANPSLSAEYIKNKGIRYVILDVSQDELDKAPSHCEKVCVDILADSFPMGGEYDLIFSKMLAEHVKDGEKFHRNIVKLLRPGGKAIHFFPTLFAPPFVLNRLVPDRLAEFLLHLIQDGREKRGKLGKFPAYYDWCRGPTTRQIRRFEGVGYSVDEYIGFYGHPNYYLKLPLLGKLHHKLSAWLVHRPVPWITSYAYVALTRRS